MRAVVADDSVFVREGIVAILERNGWTVDAAVGDAAALVDAAVANVPDLVIADIRMPPGFGAEGVLAAQQIRERAPQVGVLLVSQHIELRAVRRLLAGGAHGIGYLLKERVMRVEAFLEAATRVATGGSAIDPDVVGRLLRTSDVAGRCAALTPREREVLQLMAEGLGNEAISRRLVVVTKTVDAHISNIFAKLGLESAASEHRRVSAVLAWLRDSGALA